MEPRLSRKNHSFLLSRDLDAFALVFGDRQIKEIKSVFSAGRHSGNTGWLALCEDFLNEQLDVAEDNLTSLGIEYISQHEPDQKPLFQKKIDWPEASLKFHAWVEAVRIAGVRSVRRKPGFHDEPLRGTRKGQRSVRLSRSYRAIYAERLGSRLELIEVIEVNKHEY